MRKREAQGKISHLATHERKPKNPSSLPTLTREGIAETEARKFHKKKNYGNVEVKLNYLRKRDSNYKNFRSDWRKANLQGRIAHQFREHLINSVCMRD